MKRLAILLLALAPMTLHSATGDPVIDGFLEPAGFVQLTTLTTSTSLTGVPNGVKLTLIQAEAQNIRWRDDGTDPTATVGMILEAGQTLVYNGNPSEIELIEVAVGAIANISFYK